MLTPMALGPIRQITIDKVLDGQLPILPNADPGPDWAFCRMDVH
jgi:hypothetical protein